MRTIETIVREIDEVSAPAEKRHREADLLLQGLLPTTFEWMTDAERLKLYELQEELRLLEPTTEEIRERCRQKRAARKAAREARRLERQRSCDH